MDLKLFARVLWRFRVITVVGFIVAVGLAALSVVKVTPHGVTYRQTVLWSTTARVGVTQHGFPWGRLFAQQPTAPGKQQLTAAQQAAALGIPVADPNRLNSLAVLFADLATSDPVRRLMQKPRPIPGQLVAQPLIDPQSRIMLPLIDLSSISDSNEHAVALVRRASAALQEYIGRQQDENGVPRADRVVIQPLSIPEGARVYRARSKTMPAVILFAVMLATFGLAFVLENLRPRPRSAETTVEVPLADAAQRKTA